MAHILYLHLHLECICHKQARDLLKSLLIIGASVGLVLGIVATSIPFLAPNVFTPDRAVIAEVCLLFFNYMDCWMLMGLIRQVDRR